VGCAAKPGIGLAASGSAGALTGVASTATFAAGLAFLDDTRRTGAFFDAFFLIALVFLTAVAFLRVGQPSRLERQKKYPEQTARGLLTARSLRGSSVRAAGVSGRLGVVAQMAYLETIIRYNSPSTMPRLAL
jgi:hypothetical protein